MPGRECYHCKQWVAEGEAHDCWSTTEQALTQDLSEDLRDAWERLREAASELGEQRIYASHHSIMFARKTCYAFVRPKRRFLELCIFLGRTVRAPQIRRAIPSSKTRVAHMIQVRHRDEVETPLTDWLRDAYQLQDAPAAKAVPAKKAVIAKKAEAAKKQAVSARKKPSPRTPPPRAARTPRRSAARRRG